MNSHYREITNHYTRWLDTLGHSPHVVRSRTYNIRVFFNWLQQQNISRVNQLNQQHINRYFSHLETRSNKLKKGVLLHQSTLNSNFSAVDKLLEFLHVQGLHNVPLPTNKRFQIDKEERLQKIEVFTQEEIKTLYNSIANTYPHFNVIQREKKHYQLKLMFALYYACGLRLSEGLKIRLQDIDFERKTVFVKQGKNYKDRIVPMSGGVYRDLQDYIYNFRNSIKLSHNRLFIHDKTALSKSLKHLQNSCKNEAPTDIGLLIGQKRLYPHILRHSIATHLLQNGMSIEQIGRFLGHNCLDSTQIYTHIIER